MLVSNRTTSKNRLPGFSRDAVVQMILVDYMFTKCCGWITELDID